MAAVRRGYIDKARRIHYTDEEEGREGRQVQGDAHILPGSAPVDTSEDAAEHMRETGKAATRRAWVLQEITKAGEYGRTNFELVDAYGGPQYQTGIQPRTTELSGPGFGKIRDSGRRRSRGGKGLGSIVWIRTTPAEESAILEEAARTARLIVDEPSAAAYKAADALLEAVELGGFFRQRRHFAWIIQKFAINPIIRRGSG